jgi:hypothetical protein
MYGSFGSSLSEPGYDNHQALAELMAALQGVPPPSQYTGGGYWIMDTRNNSQKATNPSILTSSSPPPLHTSIIICNGAPLLFHCLSSSVTYTMFSPLHLNNVLISPHLIKNLISHYRKMAKIRRQETNEFTIVADEFMVSSLVYQ